ncbi:LLM class flavin-dependent oxidoreductase, partial [Streptomyces sp. MCAF7]
MLCTADGETARSLAREPINRYLRMLAEAASEWTTGVRSADYPGYEKMIEKLRQDDFDRLHERGSALVGSPDEITTMLLDYHAACGGFEAASIQFYFSDIDPELARGSLQLFAEHV